MNSETVVQPSELAGVAFLCLPIYVIFCVNRSVYVAKFAKTNRDSAPKSALYYKNLRYRGCLYYYGDARVLSL